MTIIRVEKRKTYVVMEKVGLEDERLSFKAKGILAYLLSRPDNWKSRVDHLKTISTDQRDSVRTGLIELEEAGYLTREPKRDHSGKIIKWESIIREIPTSSPETDFPTLDKPTLDNPTLIINELISNDYKKIEEEEDAENFLKKFATRFRFAFNKIPSENIIRKVINLAPNTEIIFKAFDVSELKGDKPAYLIELLDDWKNQKLINATDVDDYLDKRKSANKFKSDDPVEDNSISVDEMEAKGWQ